MNKRNWIRQFAAGAACCLVAVSAFSNGINPPRPKDALIVTAACKDASGNPLRLVKRAQIKERATAARSQFLQLRIDGATQQLPLSEISTLAFASGAVDRDGFAAAALARHGDDIAVTVAVRVKSGSSRVKLAGFSDSAASIEVDLLKCKRIEFAIQGEQARPQPSETPRDATAR
jgi:hypothetical protein